MLISVVNSNFTRPADTTAYASGDLVANSTTAGSVTPLSFTIWRAGAGQTIIQRARLAKSGTSTTSAAFRIHFYQATQTVTNGDNGAWLSTGAQDYLGNIDIAAMFAFSDGANGFGAAAAGAEMRFRFATGNTLYCLLEARGAYTPASAEVFTLYLECLDAY
jgi:hypothetical protein